MSAQQEPLTLGERRFLERQQEADREGVTLKEYYRIHGLSLPALYSMRRQLMRKGLLSATADERQPSKPVAHSKAFVAVRVAASPPATGGGCRMRSPSGWLIELDGLPDPVWLAGLMGMES